MKQSDSETDSLTDESQASLSDGGPARRRASDEARRIYSLTAHAAHPGILSQKFVGFVRSRGNKLEAIS